MKIRYLDAADAEFQEAIAYYNSQSAGLGFEFSDEVKPLSRASEIIRKPGLRYRSALAAARFIDFLTA